MTRRFALLLLVLPLAGAAEEKKPKPKPSYVGVMIAAGKEKGTFVILAAFKDSPAAKAGLKTGDVVLKVDGARAETLELAVKVIRALKAGKKAEFQIMRDGKEMTIEVVPREAD